MITIAKGASVRDDNYAIAIMASNLLGTQPIYLTGVNLTNSHPIHVAVVDLNGTQVVPAAPVGWTPYFANAITSTVTVSSAAGKFGGYMLINLNSSPAYLQVFDTTGAITLGSTAPTFVIPIPANSTASNGVGANLELANGVTINNGIKVACTTTANGASTVATGVSGSIWYV